MSHTNILLIGNPGTGKSTLLNGLLGRLEFESGLSFGAGKTQFFKKAWMEDPGVMLMDTPGLEDVKMRKKAAQEITKALKEPGEYKIFFVVKLLSGRVSPADVLTMETVLAAVDGPVHSFGIIINQVALGEYRTLRREGVEFERVRASLALGMGQNKATKMIHLVARDDDLEGEANQVKDPPVDLKKFLFALPSIRIPAVSEVKVRDYDAMQREMEEKVARQKDSFDDELRKKRVDLDNLRRLQEQQRRQMRDMEERACFPGSSIFQTPEGPKPVSELRVGDKVLAIDRRGHLVFDDIYFFGHAVPGQRTTYTCLCTKSTKIRLSAEHFVPVAAPGASDPREWARKGSWTRAADVKVGDLLWVQGDDGVTVEAVTEIFTCEADGIFHPGTLTGNVVADKVVASVHSGWLFNDLCPRPCLGLLPSLYQAMLFPGRLLYHALGAKAANALDVNNPQKKFQKAVGSSTPAFAFLAISTCVPLALSGALMTISL